MSHHNEGPGLSPVKLEHSENGHAVTMTGNSLATRHRRRPILNKDHNRARKLKEYRQKIISNYLPLHRELYTLNPTSFFVPSFLKAIDDNTEQSFKSIMSEPSPGIFAFEIFQQSFCEFLLSEIENFEKWVTEVEFQIMRPNSMNRYGAVLDDFGLETMLEKLMDGFIRPLSRVLYAEVGGSTLDSHHGFVVEYGKDRDVDLGFHVDDSEVTLNVCLGKEFSGGELYFRGTRCEKHVNTGSQSEEIFDYSHVPGRAVLHRGRHRHGARATTSGHRVNLLLWCRSSVFREMKRYQTDFSSWCGECNRVKKESQRSTIAATKLFSPIAPSLLVPSNITSSKTKMGVHANSSRISAITWIIGSLIMVINIYYLMTSYINPLLHSHLEIGAKVFLGILGFSGMGVYLAGIAYLVLRKNRKATRLLALTAPERQQMANEKVNEHVINF